MFAPIKIVKAGCELQQSLPSPIIHFKGFGRYINFKNHKIKKLESRCIDTLYNLLKNGGTLVWDGDSYNYGSFTFIIPLLFDQLFKLQNVKKNTRKNHTTNNYKKWLFLAFIKQKDIRRFTNSWCDKLKIDEYNIGLLEQKQINFVLKPLTEITNFIDLGIEALKITKSKIIICFGGGYVVNHEYNTLIEQYSDNNMKEMVMFYVYDVGRFNKSTQKFEFPALKSLMYFDKNISKYTKTCNQAKYDNIGYYDADIDEWSINCIDPLKFCIKISNLGHKNDDNQQNKQKKQ